MSTHVKVIGILFIVFGALYICGAFFSTVLLGILAGMLGASNEPDAHVGAVVLGMTGAVLTTILLAVGIPQVIAGWGLLKFRRWARILAIVMAAISLPNIPFGTIFGIYALIILFNRQTEALFP